MDTTEPGHEGGLTFRSKHNVGSFAMALHCSPLAMSCWLSADSSDNKECKFGTSECLIISYSGYKQCVEAQIWS